MLAATIAMPEECLCPPLEAVYNFHGCSEHVWPLTTNDIGFTAPLLVCQLLCSMRHSISMHSCFFQSYDLDFLVCQRTVALAYSGVSDLQLLRMCVGLWQLRAAASTAKTVSALNLRANSGHCTHRHVRIVSAERWYHGQHDVLFQTPDLAMGQTETLEMESSHFS